MRVHIRASGVPFTAWTPCGAGDAGARAIEIIALPEHIGRAQAGETACKALNGWSRHMGEAPDPEGTLESRPHRMRWAHAETVSEAAASLERAERTRGRAPEEAHGALEYLRTGRLEEARAQARTCTQVDARDDAKAGEAMAEARERRARAEAAFGDAREGQSGETTTGWMQAMRGLAMSGDARALERVAGLIDAREASPGRSTGPGHEHEGTEHNAARGWTQRLVREGGGLEAAAACARAHARCCEATNAVIERLHPSACEGALERVSGWVAERQILIAVNGGIVWDAHGLGTCGALAREHAGGRGATLDEEVAARAGAHTQLGAHPEGVVAAARSAMLEACGAGEAARAEQSQRWANEGWLRLEGRPEGPGPNALALGVEVGEARARGAPVLAACPDVVRAALAEAGQAGRATRHALLEAQLHGVKGAPRRGGVER